MPVRLENTFTSPADDDRTWQTLLDLERIATCVPGASLLDMDGDSFTGRVRVKLGPISMAYQGQARFVERDRQAGFVVIEASGREDRGNGTARATVTLRMTPSDGGTSCHLTTDLAVTGRPAQFGRGVMQDVSNKLIDQFAANLAAEVAKDGVPAHAPARVAHEVDLGSLVTGPLARRAAPVGAVVLAGTLLALLVARLRRGR
jgi:carbon monoxide dehydrogenase subunit G